ncbi:MAG: hypothetical protein LBD82_08630 [Deltaproteobacteria bacterium]|jgi:hypothetical protein|nr:hypothetical protein [Deltaproteobacteria bacterium]
MSKKTPPATDKIEDSAGPNQDRSLLDSLQAEVSREASPLLVFLIDHAKFIFAALVVFILVIAAAGVLTYTSAGHKKTQEEALGRILIMPEDGARLTALEEFASKADKEARTAALLALMHSAVKQNLPEKALDAWRKTAQTGNPALSFIARLAEARLMAEQGDPAGGAIILEAMLREAAPEEQAALCAALADMAEQAGDWSKAAAACEEMLRLPGTAQDKTMWEQRLAYFKSRQ